MNLITGRNFPVLRASGKTDIVSVADIVSGIASDPVVQLDLGRADLNHQGLEFLTGLMSSCGLAAGRKEWAALYRSPPSTEEVAACLAPLEPFFEMDGFMQDVDLPDELDQRPISNLFIGGATPDQAAEGRDIFSRQSDLKALGPLTAAIALFGHQSWATSGGQGYRTSMRGGGPLSVLALTGPTLWHRIWTSTETWDEVVSRAVGEMPPIASAFPWSKPYSPEVAAHPVVPEGSHPLLVYWGMPRRCRLVADRTGGYCSVTRQPSPVVYSSFVAKNRGYNYPSDVWQHPFAGYRTDKGGMKLPIRPSGKTLGLRDRVGVVVSTADGRAIRPRVVSRAIERVGVTGEVSIAFAGYVTDNAKALAFQCGTLDAGAYQDDAAALLLEDIAKAQETILFWSTSALHLADGEIAKGFRQKARYESFAIGLGRSLEAQFDILMAGFASDERAQAEKIAAFKRAWFASAEQETFRALERQISLSSGIDAHTRRRVSAIKSIRLLFLGRAKGSKDLYQALDMALPEKSKKPKKEEQK